MSSIEALFGKSEDDEDELVERAARALRDAVASHEGRRKTIKAWKPIVAKVLRVSKLYQKQFDAVLAKGIELGLFHIDRSLSYAVLAVGPEPGTEPEVEAEETQEPVAEETPVEPLAKTRNPTAPDTKLDPDWEPPALLDCGHEDVCTDEQNAVARAEGHCCHHGKLKYAPDYRNRKGKFGKLPVPGNVRRTKEKVEMGGFPGLCCDGDGRYIGGTFNDCHRENPKDESKWCEFHRAEAEARRASRPKAEPEPKAKRKAKRKAKAKAGGQEVVAEA